MKLKQKLASSGSLEGLKKLVAEFYCCLPVKVQFSSFGDHYSVGLQDPGRLDNPLKVMVPVVVQQGRRFVFGVPEVV